MIFEGRGIDAATAAVITRGEAVAAEMLALVSALDDLTDRLVAKTDRGGDPGRDE